jgi:hypothetical protein
MARQIKVDVLQIVGARAAYLDAFHAGFRLLKLTRQYTRFSAHSQTGMR